MSTTLAAALIAVAGVLAVVAVAYVFYLVGRSEDRDRAPEPPAEEEGAAENGRIARERRRPLPPRRH
jgi:hypothetical protein